MKKANILVVEDEAIVGREIEISLENMGFKVVSVVRTGEKAIEKAGQDHPDIILMDIRLKGRMDGIEAAGQIRDRFDIPIIFLTAYADEEKLKRAGLTMPFGYILKPFTDRDLMVTVQMGLYTAKINAERKRTEKLLQKAHDELEQRVKERTEELSLANSQLRREMEIRALAEKSIKEAEEQFSLFMDYFPAVAFITDRSGLLLYANRYYKNRFGNEAHMGKTVSERFGEKTARIMLENNENAFKYGYWKALESVTDSIGEERIFEVHRFSIQRDNKPKLLGGIALDVTSRVESEKALEKNQARLQEAEHIARLGHWDLDVNENKVSWSDGMYRIFALNPLDFTPSLEILELIYPEDRESVKNNIDRILQKKKIIPQSHRIMTAAGEIRSVNVQGKLVLDDTGSARHIFGTMQDITEFKKMEESLKKTNRELMFLNRMIRQITAGLSFDHVIKSVIKGIDEILKPGMAILFIRKDGRLLPLLKNGHDQYTLNGDEAFVHRIGECLCGLAAKEGKPQYCMDIWNDDRCVREECRKTGYQAFAAIPLLAREEVIGVLGFGALKNHDFTDRKVFLETLADEIAIGLQNALLYEKLKRHEELFRIAAQSASDLIYEWDLKTDIMKSFGDIEKMFGYKTDQLVIVNPGDFEYIHPEDSQKVRELAEFQKKTGEPVRAEFRVRKNDAYRNWSLRGGAAFDEQGKPSRLVGVCTDITEKKESETKLIQSQEMLQAVFDGIPDPLMMVDKDMRILVINAAGARYYGIEPEKVLNRPCCQGMIKTESACDGCRIPYSVMKEKPVSFERKGLMNPERVERVVSYPVTKPSVGGRAIIRISDITEEKKNQSLLIRADRLASLGQLSGGIAHEIRNPLEGIKLFVDILTDETRYERSESEQEIFNDINLNIRRINDIIKRVLTFARPDQADLQTLDLNKLISETLKLFDTRLRKLNIRKNLHPEGSLGLVNADVIALQQVVVNLVTNAVDAMGSGGTLTIETFNSESSFFKGRLVSGIRIKDTGTGIRPEVKDSIFNPFFTTKKTGTGLGLAISHQIVERHGGTITFKSEPGQGALFIIELPAVKPD